MSGSTWGEWGVEYKDESDTLLLSRSLKSREGVEEVTSKSGHEGGEGSREYHNHSHLEHLLCAGIDIITLSTISVSQVRKLRLER